METAHQRRQKPARLRAGCSSTSATTLPTHRPSCSSSSRHSELQLCLCRYNTRHDGIIDATQFSKLCVDLGYELSPEQCRLAVKLLDTRGVGGATYLLSLSNFGLLSLRGAPVGACRQGC